MYLTAAIDWYARYIVGWTLIKQLMQEDCGAFEDMIDRKNESLMRILIDANPQYRNIAVFPANCELAVPEVSSEAKVTWLPRRAG